MISKLKPYLGVRPYALNYIDNFQAFSSIIVWYFQFDYLVVLLHSIKKLLSITISVCS